MKKLCILLSYLPFLVLAEVDLVTLDNWNIASTTEHNLFKSKKAEIDA